MKKIQIYILSFVVFLWIICITPVSAASNNDESSRSNGGVSAHHTEHPPHDHQENDHIKKLDEALARKRKGNKKAH